jgi:multiple sugar transport system permease protein
LLRPGLAATFLFLFILNWSEYFFALILSKTDVSTLPVHLNRWAGNGGANGFQAALSVGATLPLIVIGLLIRKHLVRGLSFGFVRR